MPKVIQLSPHIANLIAAGEVVERPASVVKELLENAVDAGASKVTVEIRDGGMTFLRVTDDGCGMTAEDARTAFLRHATSKLRTAEDLAAIMTMGFRGEALAAIASVSRVDIMTKTAGAISGTSLHLEAGNITEEEEVGCPEGTTILVRDLFFNTPARMKFMKTDTVEAGKVTAAVQMQALAHPGVAFRFLRDGKEVLSTPGNGQMNAAVYCVYGRESAQMVEVSSRWEKYTLTGFVSKPTQARPSRAMQTFFVNGRPVKSRLLTAALEEAYRNQMMVGKFPSCVLHLTMPANTVDVNVHPAKTEVKFLSEQTVFDCVHYGVLGALNKTPDRPQMTFKPRQEQPAPAPQPRETAVQAKKEDFYRTMSADAFKKYASALQNAPRPSPEAAAAAAAKLERTSLPVQERVFIPRPAETPAPQPKPRQPAIPKPEPVPEPEQVELPLPQAAPWRMVGELYRTYILVEQGEDAFLIDKHAAHERILFDKLRAERQEIASQMLLSPVPCRLRPDSKAVLLENTAILEEMGFEAQDFGENTLLLRQIPMDLSPESGSEVLEELAEDLAAGRREDRDTLRDELLHTVACKAAIKAGWRNDEQELLRLVEQVMRREDLKYCPHGRPICVSLSKKQLEKQFRRT
ncbi:MAG: DNA mismatch repair endonuclease MutL [Faecousia sp.]